MLGPQRGPTLRSPARDPAVTRLLVTLGDACLAPDRGVPVRAAEGNTYGFASFRVKSITQCFVQVLPPFSER